MASPKFVNTRMVVEVSHKLKKWWENIKWDHAKEVRQLLSFLTLLIYVTPDRYLIKALIKCRDPIRMVFWFYDFHELLYHSEKLRTNLEPKMSVQGLDTVLWPKIMFRSHPRSFRANTSKGVHEVRKLA